MDKLKEKMGMLKEDNRKLQEEQVFLQESCEKAKRLCEEAHEKIYDLWTKQQQFRFHHNAVVGAVLTLTSDFQQAATAEPAAGAEAELGPLAPPPPPPPSAPSLSALGLLLPLQRERLYIWQATKASLKERFDFLFNSELLSDVRFVLGKRRGAAAAGGRSASLATASSWWRAVRSSTPCSMAEWPRRRPRSSCRTWSPRPSWRC
ncbi:BTB/POZ domain-containing protein 1 [Lemmus lemmus]